MERWDLEDKAKLFAHIQEQAERCSICGTAPWEWEEDPFAYSAEHEFCLGCNKKLMMQEEDGGGKPLPGTNVVMVRRGTKAKGADQLRSRRRRRRRS